MPLVNSQISLMLLWQAAFVIYSVTGATAFALTLHFSSNSSTEDLIITTIIITFSKNKSWNRYYSKAVIFESYF